LGVRLLVLLLDEWGTRMNPSRYNNGGSRQPAQRGPEMDAEERGVVAINPGTYYWLWVQGLVVYFVLCDKRRLQVSCLGASK